MLTPLENALQHDLDNFEAYVKAKIPVVNNDPTFMEALKIVFQKGWIEGAAWMKDRAYTAVMNMVQENILYK